MALCLVGHFALPDLEHFSSQGGIFVKALGERGQDGTTSVIQAKKERDEAKQEARVA